jgi:hypothetical protein
VKNVIDAINVLIEGVNVAYSRGTYSMAEAHDLHIAIEFLKKASDAPQPTSQENSDIDKKEKDDY